MSRPNVNDGLAASRRRVLLVLVLVATAALAVRFSDVARSGGQYGDYVHDDHDVIGINVVNGHGFCCQAGKDIPRIAGAPLFPLVLGVTYWLVGEQREFGLWRSVDAAVDAASAVLLVVLVLQALGASSTFFTLLAAVAFVAWLRRPGYLRAALTGGLLVVVVAYGGAPKGDHNPLLELGPPGPSQVLTVQEELRREATLRDEAFRYVRRSPGDFALKVGDNLLQFWYDWREPAMGSVRSPAYMTSVAPPRA